MTAKQRFKLAALSTALSFVLLSVSARGDALTSLEYKIVGASLDVSPAVLSVPKGIAGSINAQLSGGVIAPPGSVIEAILRGPSFPARRLVGEPGKPLLLPQLPLIGDYSLDGIRLADANGATILEGTPARVRINVFDEVLISRVTSRPLTLEEIQERGIVIDEKNFRAIEFEVGFVLDGKTIPVKFPVVAPVFKQSTEIIPAAELEERLRQAEEINRGLSLGAALPPELEGKQLNIEVQGFNFQFVDPEEIDLALQIPSIPALLVIPGNVGFLNQFFSVLIFTENGAPVESGLSVRELTANLILPPGPDKVPGTFDQPGDDPLRPARVGPNAQIFTALPVVQPGPDGKLGTPDDNPRLLPRETGQAEFLVEGLQEGLHVMDLKLTATLDGLAAGPVQIEGKAAGSVLVRNPKFSLAFSHPRTTRAGEPYEAFVTILNTSNVPANLVNVTLREASISGGALAPDSPETVQLGTILPGETATAKYRIISQRTGSITFSNLTTSDDSLVGRFRLRAGVDERGVALSPDTLLLPDFVNDLPASVRDAANRVLGQALSVATAGQAPAGVLSVAKSFITAKALQLAEAGQRVRYGDPLSRVLPDLLLDWQGGRGTNAGFDQILRVTDAGREFRNALVAAIEGADTPAPDSGVARLGLRAPDFAGRSETWFIAAADGDDFDVKAGSGEQVATLTQSTLSRGLGYRGTRGPWLATAEPTRFEWKTDANFTRPNATIELLLVKPNGSAQQLVWALPNPPPGAYFIYDATGSTTELQVDANGDGTIDSTLVAAVTDVAESAPRLVAVFQDHKVLTGRPSRRCPVPEFGNYATVVAALFSKPMAQESINIPSAYKLENGNEAGSVQIQPGGRVALLNMRRPVGALIDRTMTINGVTDPRGNAIQDAEEPVQTTVDEGVSIRGRVVRADGTIPVGIPVTLTYIDEVDSGLSGCVPIFVRASQVFTNEQGEFAFDFVIAGIDYSISATDTSSLSAEALAMILESVSGEEFNRAKLEELANSPSVQNTLLASFAVGALPQAIAKAEGLDRALLRDIVEELSPRVGTEVVVALRFRGRGTVTGQVLNADGSTPAAGAAVNLFPDPTTRELGRGIFTDSDGRFQFNGVPLGAFSVEAASNEGLTRTVSDILSAPGETREITVVLSASAPELTELAGFVVEAEGGGHSGAQVFVGRFIDGKFTNIVSATTTADGGVFTATKVPLGTYDVVAISADGRRKGQRLDVAAVSGTTNPLTIPLQGFGVVVGFVETGEGVRIANAFVAGGEALVQTGPDGSFILTGVPTGQRTIEAGVQKNEALGIDFPRLGSASVNVLPGVQNFARVRLNAAGRIRGIVFDAIGQPVPNVVVALPEQGGFSYVKADGNGVYEFVGVEVGRDYVVSAPAPPTGPGDNSDALIQQIASGDQDKILAAIGEAFATFTGVNDPLLNGEGLNFNPLTWGFKDKVRVNSDGDTAEANIQFLRLGTVSGRVENGQGVPIGARVRLTGLGPMRNGDVGTIIRGERDSDPALGTFDFPGEAFEGHFGLQAASPFFPVVITESGRIDRFNPDVTGIVMRFPHQNDSNGRVKGRVFNPDGTPVGADVNVKISFGNDFIIRTIADGTFDTQIGLPALGEFRRPGVGYTVQAHDTISGLRGEATVIVFPGIDNFVEVQLLGLGDILVEVRKSDGSVAVGATVEVKGGSFPRETLTGTTGTDGRVTLENLFAGPYAVCASLPSGPTTLTGRVGVNIVAGSTANVVVPLIPTAAIKGIFLSRDRTVPIQNAQIAVGNLGFATTGLDGRFEIAAIPLGTYRLISNDPVSGRSASVTVTLAVPNEVREVQLVESALGEVFGNVANGFNTGFVPNARVTLNHSDAFIGQRTVTTGPDGGFRFPGTPAGAFSLVAKDPVTGLEGRADATLPESASQFQINVQLQPLATLVVTVKEVDNTTPASAMVRIAGGGLVQTAGTNAEGVARFTNLPLDEYEVRANSLVEGFTRRAASTTSLLAQIGGTVQVELRLGGVGTLSGTVFASDGLTPVALAPVTLSLQSALFEGEQVPQQGTNAQGQYSFTNVPVGDFRVSVENQSLAASANGNIPAEGATVTQDLTLTPSGTVIGRLVRADNVTPVAGVEAIFTFASPSSLPGRAVARTESDGTFTINAIPVGAFRIDAFVNQFTGIARRNAQLTTNGETLDVGDVRLDEDFPSVVQVTPPNSAPAVSTNIVIELLFNEALNPTVIEPNGIFLRKSSGGGVASSLQLVAPAGDTALRLVRLTPNAPLESNTTYEMVVVDGERRDALGGVIGRGPIDLVDRPLTAPFFASFTTRDDTPPTILSFTPENNQQQLDTRTVIRLSFDEPVQPGASIVLQGSGGPIAGTTALGLNGLVLVFTPTLELPPNATFTTTVNGVRDLAGNFAVGQPLNRSFGTLDTVGPNIAQLRIKNNQPPIANTNLVLEALLVQAENEARVRFSQNFTVLGSGVESAPGLFEFPFTVPSTGTFVIRATALDRFNNEGVVAELPLTVQANTPPAIAFTQLIPSSGPLLSGSAFSVRVSATDDGAVTELRAAALGAAVQPLQTTTGAPIVVTRAVPSLAVPGSKVIIVATAKDNSGSSTPETQFEIPVSDGTPPQLTIVNPPANSVVEPPQLTLEISSADNGGAHGLVVNLTGAVTGSAAEELQVPPNQNTTTNFIFDISSAPLVGGSFTATVTATDSVGRITTTARTFALPDRRPPQLLTIAPPDLSTRQSLWLSGWTLSFDEALNPASIVAGNFVLRDATDVDVPFSAQVLSSSTFIIRPQLPLRPGTLYRLTVKREVADAAGNLWKDVGGLDVPVAGRVFSASTAAILTVLPAVQTKIVPGQKILARVDYEDGLGATQFAFGIGGSVPTVVAAGATRSELEVTLPIDATDARLTITARRSGLPDFSLPEVALDLRPRTGDDDGDGWLNGFEADRGMNPFVANLDSEDFDNDGLNNGQERTRGTDPGDADSDDDTLTDGAEVAANSNPLDADSDDDGLRDDVDPFPTVANLAPVANADAFSVPSGEQRTILIASELLNNDTDPENQALALVSFTQPANATVTQPNATAVLFTPNPGFSGVTSFSYTIRDPGGLTAAATVTLTIGTNARPFAGELVPYESGGLVFDGSDDSASGPLLPTLTNNFTIEFWVRPDRNRGSITEGNSGASGQFIGEFAVFPTHGDNFGPASNSVHAGAGVSVGRNGVAVVEHGAGYFPAPLVLNTDVPDWTHIAVVYENGRPSLYLNGVFVKTGVQSGRAQVHPGTDLSTQLGRFKGQLDEYRIWNHPKNADQIAAAFRRRITGAETGLAVYWRMDEPSGNTLVSSEPLARNGTLNNGTGRIIPAAPLDFLGVFTVVQQDIPSMFILPGSDADGNPLTARIHTLPVNGALFQFTGSGAGAEITQVPTNVSDPERRVLYQPDSGFLGDDAFVYSVFDASFESERAESLLRMVPPFSPVTNDVWDVSAGNSVTSSTAIHPQSAGTNMFGASGGVEPSRTIFGNGQPAGFVHAIEWESPGFLRIEGARLFASDDGPGLNGQRGFTEMRLFGRLNPDDPFTFLAKLRPGANPYFASVAAQLLVKPFVGKQFRAEFDQFGSSFFGGPRIEELDAIGETVVLTPGATGVPIPLQNATATFSQGGFPAGNTIDGDLSSSGWAIVGGPTPQTIVWETAADIAADADTEFIFNFIQNFGGAHFLGAFRISATTDARSAFADGAVNGGDVTANWVVLDPTQITSTGGETFTVRPDKAIVVTGVMPSTTTNTVRVKGIEGLVTGFRVEMVNDASLGGVGGPGRTSHGNFVLTEVTAAKANIIGNRAPRANADTGETIQDISFTTINVLLNDFDPEGDAISMLDFTQPAAGTGTVAHNGDGTFTYTPAPAFIGTASFTYRTTDTFQNSAPATVTITVRPTQQRVWTNLAGGNWSNPANWLNGILPGPDDIAVIELDGTYTVALDVNVTVSQLRLGAASGVQTLNVNGRTLTVLNGGTGTTNARLIIPSGTANFNGATTFGTLEITGGTLGGSGTVTVTGTLSWTDGDMRGSGTTVLAAGATGTISSTSQKSLQGARIFENSGTLTYSGNELFFNLNGVNPTTAKLVNLAGGVLEVQGEADFRRNVGSSSAVENAGLFRKTGPGTTFFESSTVQFVNTGTVEVLEGALEFRAGGSTSGPVTLAAGTTLFFTGGTFTQLAGGTISGAGGLRATGGTAVFEDVSGVTGPITASSGTLTFTNAVGSTGALTINGGTINFEAAQTFSSFILNSGTLGGAGTVTVTGTLSWTEGDMRGSGTTVLAAGATGTISSTSQKSLQGARIFANSGTLTYSGNELFFNLNSINPTTAKLVNLAGGVLEVQGEADFRRNVGSSSAVENAGLFRKTGPGTTFFESSTVQFVNTGTVEVLEGALEFRAGGSTSGPVTLAAGTRLFFTGGTFTQLAGGTISGAGGLNATGGTAVLEDVSGVTGPITVSSGTLTFTNAVGSTGALTINGGTINFEAAQTFSSFILNSGTLGGAGTVTVTGTLSWTEGDMRGSGTTVLAAGATGTISSTSQKSLQGARIFENSGTLTYSGNELFFNLNGVNPTTAKLVNLAGGVLEVQGEADFRRNVGSSSAVENAGLFRKTGPGTTFFESSTVQFVNTGTVEVLEGALEFRAGGSTSGPVTLAAGTTLFFTGGTFTQLAGGTISGAGGLRATGGTAVFEDVSGVTGPITASSGTLTFTNAVGSTGALTINGGTINFEAAQTFSSFILNSGTLGGAGTVTVTGTLSWTEGDMRGSGTTVLAAGATGTISTTSQKSLQGARIFENSGTLTYSGNELFFNLNSINPTTAKLVNLAGGVLEVQGEADFRRNVGSSSAVENAGLFRKTGPGTTFFESSTVQFVNTGTLEVLEGALEFRAGGSTSGPVTLAAGTTLLFTGGTFTQLAGGTINGAGGLRATGGTAVFEDVAGVTGPITVSSGTLTFDLAQTFSSLILNGGTLGGAGTVTVTGTLSWTEGDMRGSGKTVLAAGATGTISTTSQKSLQGARILENGGTLTYSGNELFFNLNSINPTTAKLVNLAGGVLEVQGEADFRRNATANSAVENAGLFRKTGPGTTFFESSTVQFVNTGTVEVLEGSLEFRAGFAQSSGALRLLGGSLSSTSTLAVQGGTVEGAGTITGSVNSSGTFAPGDAAGDATGTITITGSYTQTAAGTLAIELGGTGAGAFDALAIGGAVTLDGTVAVSLVSGFALANNQNFAVLTFASRAGDFATNTGLTQGGITLSKNYTATALTLSTPVAAGSLGPLALRSDTSDADGDGLSDIDELRAGTDGADPLSALKVGGLSRNGDDITIHFATVAGRSYSIEFSDSLAPGSWKVLKADLVGTGGTLTVVDRGAAKLERRFYRIRVGAATGAVSGFLQIRLTDRRTPVSSPFDLPAVAAGRVTSLNGASFTDAYAGWSPERFVQNPHTARFRTSSGWLDLPVVTQDGKTIGVSLRDASLDQIVRAGDYYEIAHLATAAELLLASGADAQAATIELRSGRSFERIAPARQDGELDPAEGLILAKKSSRATTAWFAGEVRAARHPSELSIRPLDFIGTHTPLPITLEALRAHQTPFWRANRRLSRADLLRLWMNGRFLGHYFDGDIWRSAGSSGRKDFHEIPAGSAFLIERARK